MDIRQEMFLNRRVLQIEECMAEITQSRFGDTDVRRTVIKLVVELVILFFIFNTVGYFVVSSLGPIEGLYMAVFFNFVAAMIGIYVLIYEINNLIIRRIIQFQDMFESKSIQTQNIAESSDSNSPSNNNRLVNITLKEEVAGLEKIPQIHPLSKIYL